MFSITAISAALRSSASTSTTGTCLRPAITLARRRRSPAINSYLPAALRRQTSGWITPLDLIDSDSSLSASSLKSWRGGHGERLRGGGPDQGAEALAETVMRLVRGGHAGGGLLEKGIGLVRLLVRVHGYIPAWSSPVSSGNPNMTFMFWSAWPAWPFIRLSMIETMRSLRVRGSTETTTSQ